MKVWESKHSFTTSNYCHGKLLIGQENVGIIQLINDSLQLLPGSEIFAEAGIFVILPYKKQNLLIGTREKGFFIYNSNTGSYENFPTRVDDYLKKNLLNIPARIP